MKRLLTIDDFYSMSEKESIDYQNKKFSAYVKYQLFPNSPYFRKLFKERDIKPEDINSIEDWQLKGLPLITKAEYREHLQEMVIDPWNVDGEKRSLEEVAENYIRLQEALGELETRVMMGKLPHRNVYAYFGTESLDDLKKFSKKASKDDESARRLRQALDYAYTTFSVFFTGGSTGLPTAISSTKLDRDLYRQSTIIMMGIAGGNWITKEGGKVNFMTLYPYAPHQGWWVTNWGAEYMADFYISSSGGGVMPVEGLIILASRFQINVITGMPGFLRNKFLRKAVELKKLMPGLKFSDHMMFNMGGEKIVPPVKNDIRDMLHEMGVKEVQLTGAWGASETRFNLLGECDVFEETGYHSTGWDKVAYRIVKMKSTDDWEFAKPGEEGFVVQFPMDGAGTLIEGFLLGDKAVQLSGPCPVCGSYVERFVNPLRADELDTQLMVMGLVEQKVKGASVNLTDLRTQLMEMPEISELQIIVSKQDLSDSGSPDILKIHITPAEDLSISESELLEKVKAKTKQLSEITPEVKAMDINELMGEGLKFKGIVDERPKG
jgi:phenylacetate-coenzyme A ligase PaaK-like adenylate-forming protein